MGRCGLSSNGAIKQLAERLLSGLRPAETRLRLTLSKKRTILSSQALSGFGRRHEPYDRHGFVTRTQSLGSPALAALADWGYGTVG